VVLLISGKNPTWVQSFEQQQAKLRQKVKLKISPSRRKKGLFIPNNNSFTRNHKNIMRRCRVSDLHPLGWCTAATLAKKAHAHALAAKPEVEIWWQPVVLTQRPRLPIRLRIHYGVYLALLPLYQGRILTLAHCNSRRTWKVSHCPYYSRNWPISSLRSCHFKTKADTSTKLARLVVLVG